jgi:hypothetical protein
MKNAGWKCEEDVGRILLMPGGSQDGWSALGTVFARLRKKFDASWLKWEKQTHQREIEAKQFTLASVRDGSGFSAVIEA